MFDLDFIWLIYSSFSNLLFQEMSSFVFGYIGYELFYCVFVVHKLISSENKI